MKNMKLITEAWKKFVNEGNGGEEEDPWGTDDPSGGYKDPDPASEEETSKAVKEAEAKDIKDAYAAFQNSSSERAGDTGGWIYSLHKLGEIIHKVRGYSSLHHGTRPFDDIINKHLEVIGPDTNKRAYLEDKIKKDSAILKIVNGALDAIGQASPAPTPSVSKPEPGSRDYYKELASKPGALGAYGKAMATEGKEPKARR